MLIFVSWNLPTEALHILPWPGVLPLDPAGVYYIQDNLGKLAPER